MKKLLAIALLGAATFFGFKASAQVKGQDMETYRRSSLTMVMLEDANLSSEVAHLVRNAFVDNQMPAKFNDHRIAGYTTFTSDGMTVSVADRKAYNEFTGEKKKTKDSGAQKGAGMLGALLQLGPSAQYAKYQHPVVDTLTKNAPFYAYKYIKENDLARKMMKKWFYDEDGNLTPKIIFDRAFENATEAQKQEALENTGGSANAALDYIMNHGGWDLISNTFVTVSSFRYFNAADMYDKIMNDTAIGAQYMPQGLADTAMAAAEMAATAAVTAMGNGYAIYTTTYLYRLVWNPEVQAAVNDCIGKGNFDEYEFQLEYIGEETAQAQVAQRKRTFEEAVAFATSRSLDKVIAKLEKKYEVFRTKTPLLSIDPVTAGIGTKECVKKGDKYDVLSVSQDKNGMPVYKTVATIVVETVGNNMGEDCDELDELGASSDTFTTFKGKLSPKVAHPGTLIRQASGK